MKYTVIGFLALILSAPVFANCSERVASSEKIGEVTECQVRQFDVRVIADLVARGMSEADINQLADDTPMPAERLDRIHKWVHEALGYAEKGNLSAWVMAHQEKCE